MKKIIVLSFATIAMLTFTGCNNNKTDDTKSAVETTKGAASNVVTAAKDAVSKTAETVKNGAEKATQATKEVATVAAKTAEKTVDATKEVATATVKTAKKAVDATKEAVTATAAAATGGNEKGKAVFAKCVSCHGTGGKTKALGKSEIIAGQPAADLEKKILGYKAGTRNVAGMGMLMKGQVGTLSDEDIKAVAQYISSLK